MWHQPQLGLTKQACMSNILEILRPKEGNNVAGQRLFQRKTSVTRLIKRSDESQTKRITTENVSYYKYKSAIQRFLLECESIWLSQLFSSSEFHILFHAWDTIDFSITVQTDKQHGNPVINSNLKNLCLILQPLCSASVQVTRISVRLTCKL